MLQPSESPPPPLHRLPKSKRIPSPPPSSMDHYLKSSYSVLSALYHQLHLHLRHRHRHRLRLTLFLAMLLFQLLLILSTGSLPVAPLRQLFLRQRGAGDSILWPSAVDRLPSRHCNITDLIYVYDLSPVFNYDLLDACEKLNPWKSQCTALSNAGFGPSATEDLAGVIPDKFLSSWYATDQFASEIIFHRRVLAYPCRTMDPDTAAAFYVPFYVGLSVGRSLWTRNSTATDHDCALFLQWIRKQPPWKKSNGEDHFMAISRITWDFRRVKDGSWGSSFFNMDGASNITRLIIERSNWISSEIGIPYPTSFHPRSAAEVQQWQEFVLNSHRPTLFSFVGGVRTRKKDDFRGLLLDECRRESESGACRSVSCQKDHCRRMADTVGLFQSSKFCLQPRGDSFTRRSMFDCMVAGAVPVFFWQETSQKQYLWHLPSSSEEEEREWSVFIDRNAIRNGTVTVRGELEKIGEEKVERMKKTVVEMIPRLVYAAGEQGLGEGMKDAFDVAVDGVLRRLSDRRRRQDI